MGFIEDFLEASSESESPKSYWLWAGLSAISAVVKRNVWIQRPTWKTYPNIFVLLVGESGLRKGVPIGQAKDLVAAVNNTRIISGRSSVQGIISHLGTAYTTPDGRVIDKAYGYISSSEFSSSIVRDPDSLTILTDLYDSCYHDKWVDMLRSGRVELIEPSITLIAGINPPHFEDYVSATAIQGGFVGRVFLVFENEKACINPAIRKETFLIDNKAWHDKVVKQLKAISRVKGEMQLTEGAIQVYEKWYYSFEDYRKQTKLKDKTGSINRIGEHILKIGILLSLSRSTDNILTEEDIDGAMKVCLTSLSHVNKTTVSQGKAQYAPQTKLVITELINAENHEVSRTKLLSRNYGEIDAFDLDRVVDSLIQSGGVQQERRGNELFYSLTKRAIKELGAE